jgi:hypothetical protein
MDILGSIATSVLQFSNNPAVGSHPKIQMHSNLAVVKKMAFTVFFRSKHCEAIPDSCNTGLPFFNRQKCVNIAF